MTPASESANAAAPLFPGIVTARLAATAEFYLAHFDFRAVQTGEETMLLARSDGARLALLRAGNFDQPAALQTPTRGTGLWLALETEDIEATFSRVHLAGAEVIASPEFTHHGARRFVVRDPNGVLVYVTERTVPVRDEFPASLETLHDHAQDHRDSVHRLSRH